MNTIDLMIIGAQKAGTTSLKNYLTSHSDIESHVDIELDYYHSQDKFKDFKDFMLRTFTKGRKIKIAKNATIYKCNDLLKKVSNDNPDIKIVFMIRNPTDRCFSSFNMSKFKGWYKKEFSAVIENIHNKNSIEYKEFIELGLYDKYYENILKYFKKENVIIIKYEDFIKNTLNTIKFILKKIDLEFEENVDFNKIYNKSTPARSKIISSIIYRLNKKDNKLKNFIKKILPSKLFFFLTKTLFKLNTTKRIPKEINLSEKKILLEYYNLSIKSLNKKISISLDDWLEIN